MSLSKASLQLCYGIKVSYDKFYEFVGTNGKIHKYDPKFFVDFNCFLKEAECKLRVIVLKDNEQSPTLILGYSLRKDHIDKYSDDYISLPIQYLQHLQSFENFKSEVSELKEYINMSVITENEYKLHAIYHRC